MGVIILDRTYRSTFRQLDNHVNWLIGNAGTWQKLTLLCEFSVEINFDNTNPLFIDDPDSLTIGNGRTWNSYGFAEGDNIIITYTYRDTSNPSSPVDYHNTIPGTGTISIDRLDGSTAYIVDSSGNPMTGWGAVSSIMPIKAGSYDIVDVKIVSESQPEGIKFTYGHIENSSYQSANLSSFIDGTLTEFLAENTDSMTFGGTKTMIPLGNQSGMSVSECILTYVAKQGSKYIYQIDLVFMISSFFDDITNFQDNVSPPVTFDANSLTDQFEIIGMPVYNNPNITIKNDLSSTAKLGNTGWFDENFNGLTNPFTVSSFNYTDITGAITMSQLDYANPVKVTAIIDGVQNIVPGQTKCSFGFAFIPVEDSEFKQNQNPFYKNLMMNTGGNGITGSTWNDSFVVSTSPSGLRQGYSSTGAQMSVDNVLFSATGVPDQLKFECEFAPNTDFYTLMDAKDVTERNYILWVSVADQNEITNHSDRVSLLLDFNQLDTYIPPIGEYDGLTIEFLDHTQDEDDVSVPCGNDIRIEDDILSRVFLQIDTAVDPLIPIVTGLEYGIIAERTSDGFQYALDNYKVDLTQYPDPTQFNFDASRGFKLVAGNNKNFIKVDYWSPLDSGTEKGVRGLYGFKVRWEDWLKRLGVPQTVEQDIYDNTQKQNGINNDWFHWLSVSGYNLYFVVWTHATLNNKVVKYENKKPLVFVDYDANATITTEFLYYRESDYPATQLIGGTDPVSGLPLGVILSNERVRLIIRYTSTNPVFLSLSNIYGINCLEVDEGIGQMEFRQLSSIWGSEPDNPLIPLTGSTLLDVNIVSSTILECSCLIEPSKLIPANRYKISGREGCKT